MSITTVPDSPDGLTPVAARIYAALHASPGSTAAELAQAASAGKSTTGKLLARMEQGGLVRRVPGESEGNRRLPDGWYAATTTLAEQNVSSDSPDSAQRGADPESIHEVGDDVSDPPTSADEDNEVCPQGPGEERKGCADGQRSTQTPGSATQSMTAPVGEAPPTGRLGQGGLRALVHGFLAAHPDAAHSPTKVSRQLGRSSGAVANALVTLVDLGLAEMVSAKPRTYRLVASHAQPK
ncbi:MarR family transcriptional regulator [Streptacidiphilus neutrinimicus]|uniref:MarR family transcriptional regulator n=1 Tax=Streptacidiphilus neutrinimicus TaxID=105420 RepID=UPI0005A761B2|nr:helix-turn-helix domain-containing protein [Streptacidiphilus neutrinimicus]